MYTDLFSLYQQNTEETGFWVRKKNWSYHVAQVLKVKNRLDPYNIAEEAEPRVIVMIMDTRNNEIEDIVEIAEPNAASYIKLNQDYKPNYILPTSMIDYIVKNA